MLEFLLLFFIFIGEAGLAAIVYLAGDFTNYPELIFFSVYFLQFLASGIQGGISDHSCRRISLVVGFCAILLGQIFFLLAFKHRYFIALTIILYGLLGNVTPIARAALIDTEFKDDFRLSVGLSTVAIALGWVSMMYASYYLTPFVICLFLTVLCFLCGLLSLLVKDKADLEPYIGPHSLFKSLIDEMKHLGSLLKDSWVRWGLGGYLTAEVAFYQIFARGEAEVNNPNVRFIIVTWVLGYCAGVLLQNWLIPKNKDKEGMISGVTISAISMMVLIVITLFNYPNIYLKASTNILFALGFGFFVPCLFSMVSKKYGIHLQGKIYGLIDADDSLALMIAVGVIYFSKEIRTSYTLLISFFLTLITLYLFILTIRSINNKKKTIERN